MLFVFGFTLFAGLGNIPQSIARSISQGSDVCHQLNEKYDNVTFLQGDPLYPELRTENWSQTAWRTPSCIVRPTDTSQVQSIVKLLVDTETKFAIRSGGHTPSPEAANIDGGVLIDMAGFNKVSYDKSTQTAVIGSGLTWGEAYARLDAFGVTAVGGRVDSVGVGGLTLGSGLSYLSDLYGLACDNVVSHEIVLADGSAVNATRKMHSDLHWALKGGTNNFGVVTSFTVFTYPIGKVWAGIKSYGGDDLPALYDAMFAYQTTTNKDPHANLMLQGFITKDDIQVILSVIYLKPVESPPAFAPFYHINTTSDTTGITGLSTFISGQGPSNFPPRAYFRTGVFQPHKGLYGSLTDYMTLAPGIEKMKALESGTVAFGLQPISTSLIDAGKRRGGNALGLNHVDQTWYVINSGCANGEDEETMRAATHSILDPVVGRAKTEGVDLPYLFMNDAGWDQDVITSYGKENVERLRQVRAKYDAGLAFQKLVPGGFKLH